MDMLEPRFIGRLNGFEFFVSMVLITFLLLAGPTKAGDEFPPASASTEPVRENAVSCESTVAARKDVYAQVKVTGQVGAAVSYWYEKTYCDGHLGTRVGPYYGTIGKDGTYLAGMLGSFKLENTQDIVTAYASVNGMKGKKVLTYNDFGFYGLSVLYPLVAEISDFFPPYTTITKIIHSENTVCGLEEAFSVELYNGGDGIDQGYVSLKVAIIRESPLLYDSYHYYTIAPGQTVTLYFVPRWLISDSIDTGEYEVFADLKSSFGGPNISKTSKIGILCKQINQENLYKFMILMFFSS